MSAEILVTYSTRTGSTKGVSEAMAKGESYRSIVSVWLEPIRYLVTPVSEGIFAGTLDIKKIPSFSDRLKFRLSVLFGVWKEGDNRDWKAIELWAKNLKTLL